MHPDIIVAIIGCILLLCVPTVYWHYSTKDKNEKKFSLLFFIGVILGDILILFITFKTYGGF